jgi:DNA-binding MarR family transcriptional regulator
MPGPYIRRLQQIAVAIFLQETEGFGVTPVQYGALLTVSRQPGLDQRTLAALMGLDTSTTAGVVDRLETRGLLRRSASPNDRRVKRLSTTDEGATLLTELDSRVTGAQTRMLNPLSDEEKVQFLDMLTRLVEAHNEASRTPTEGVGLGDG